MSFFPIKAKDWNRDGPKVNKKRSKTTKLPMTQAQGDEFQLKKMGQIKPHSIDKVRDDQKKRLTELENKALTILDGPSLFQSLALIGKNDIMALFPLYTFCKFWPGHRSQ